MNSISQQVNLLVPCHSICSYLTLSNQLELLFFQRCLLIIVFKYISRKNRLFKSNIHQITYHNFSLRPMFFQMFQTKIQCLNMIGQNTIMKNSFQTTSQQIGLALQNNNIDVSSQNVFNFMNNVLYKYAPLKNQQIQTTIL